jgi:hypothetical protein
MLQLSAPVKWGGLALIVLVGLVHAVQAPEYFGKAAYVGVLFVLNLLGALGAAYGIWRGERWGWWLGTLVAGGAFVLYILSRTVGLPGFYEAEWADGGGLISLTLEGLFLLWTLWAGRASSTGPGRSTTARA